MSRIHTRRNRRSNAVSENLEQLEIRRVPVGNITAGLQAGVLTVTGDNLGNDVVVQRNAVGAITVTGLNQTLVNGVAPSNGASVASFFGVTDLVIQTNNGDDSVRVGGNLIVPTILRDISIDTGAGNDKVELIRTIAGDDLNILTKNGNDTVTLTKVTVGFLGQDNNQNDLQINTARISSGAADADVVKLNEVKVKRDLSITTGDDADVVQLFDPRALRPVTAGVAQAITVGDDLRIDTGDAADKVTLILVNVVDELDIELRSGDDTLNVRRTTADDAHFDGGLGRDSLVLLDNLFSNLDEDRFEL